MGTRQRKSAQRRVARRPGGPSLRGALSVVPVIACLCFAGLVTGDAGRSVLTAARRAEARAAAVDLLTRDDNLLALPDDRGQGAGARAAAVDAPGTRAAIRGEIAAIWVPSQVASRTADVLANLRLAVASPALWTFARTEFVVSRWGEVTGKDSMATVRFTGHFSDFISATGTWADEKPVAVTVSLASPSPHHWKLVNWSARSLAGQG